MEKATGTDRWPGYAAALGSFESAYQTVLLREMLEKSPQHATAIKSVRKFK